MEQRIYRDFTAQGFNVHALMSLYAQLEKDRSPRPNLIPIVVFMAFSIESYLNSIGSRVLDIWDELERLPWRKKVEILHKMANRTAKWGNEPLQFANEVFKLRDKLAHGKPERVIAPAGDEPVTISDLEPEWYRTINKEWVIASKEQFHQLMIYFGALFDFHESDHLELSTGGTIAWE